jgi:uncharacterized FlgJ-related protein
MKTGCCNTTHILRMEVHSICINPDCENYLGITAVHKHFKGLRNTFALSALTFCLLFTIDDFSMENKEELAMPATPVIETDQPTVASVQKELNRTNIYCPDVVLAQVRLESGNFTSLLFKRTNNMIGMRYPFKRTTTAAGIYIPSLDTVIIGTQKELKKYSRTLNYAVYKRWRDCIADYKLWQEGNFNINRHYISFLGNVYAKDSLYMDKLRRASVGK